MLSLTLSRARWDAPFKVPLPNRPAKGSPLQRSMLSGDSSTPWLGICWSRTSVLSIRGRQPTSLRSAWARCSSASFRRVTSASSMRATRRRAHEGSSGRHLSLPEKLQLPLVDGWRPGFQRRYVDAARRSGLARADTTNPSRCVSAGHCDGPAVRPATSAPALDWIGCGPPQSAQAPDAHPGNDGRACAHPGSSNDRRSHPALACVCTRLSVWLCRGAGCPSETDLRGRDGGRCGSHECRGIELNLI